MPWIDKTEKMTSPLSEQVGYEVRLLEESLAKSHRTGMLGLGLSRQRSRSFDALFAKLIGSRECAGQRFSLVAQGGYGRGELNPSSDIDLLFLLPVDAEKLDEEGRQSIASLLYALWDAGLKVGHIACSIGEALERALGDPINRTSLMDVRFIAGDRSLFERFVHLFEKKVLHEQEEVFFEQRRKDLAYRHHKYAKTVFLQEPHVKEGCGGLRDYQNVLWVARVKRNIQTFEELQEQKLITKSTLKQMHDAYDFLHRVRNELHYQTGRSTDILTLRLQGQVATALAYPHESILRRCEAFMKDYYRHTRAIFTHSTSLMEHFDLEQKDAEGSFLSRFFPFASKATHLQRFDGFIVRHGRLFLQKKTILEEDSLRLMRLFEHCQIKKLALSPQARRYIHRAAKKIDRTFRYNKQNRRVFRSLLEKKGEVAHVMRMMHRTKVLDGFLPEFGALDCLVQHEFFHRYTADEHTLRCLEALDSLVDSNDKKTKLFRHIFYEMEDPYALYLAFILHDTGRAENVREHCDASAILADKVCRRLQITGGRRSLLMFLVYCHLTFWRYATSRNLEDPAVIEEFGSIVKNRRQLEALLLFTWADSKATSEESWTPWKESLILQLYHTTLQWLDNGKNTVDAIALQKEQKDSLYKRLDTACHQAIDEHFERMPERYFLYRGVKSMAVHIQSVLDFLAQERQHPESFSCSMEWITRKGGSFSELVVTAWNRPLFLEKICCALAESQINILSADVFTRSDGIVCDLFKVCTTQHTAVSSKQLQQKVYQTFFSLNTNPDPLHDYKPQSFLKKRFNFLHGNTLPPIAFPLSVRIDNTMSEDFTVIELQTRDRIGLLHDIFITLADLGLATVHARICTEMGAAIDTLYVTWAAGGKVNESQKHAEIKQRLGEIITVDDGEES